MRRFLSNYFDLLLSFAECPRGEFLLRSCRLSGRFLYVQWLIGRRLMEKFGTDFTKILCDDGPGSEKNRLTCYVGPIPDAHSRSHLHFYITWRDRTWTFC